MLFSPCVKTVRVEQKKLTEIHIKNISVLQIINNNTFPTECTQHINVRYFAIQDWREYGDIIVKHIPGIINP